MAPKYIQSTQGPITMPLRKLLCNRSISLNNSLCSNLHQQQSTGVPSTKNLLSNPF